MKKLLFILLVIASLVFVIGCSSSTDDGFDEVFATEEPFDFATTKNYTTSFSIDGDFDDYVVMYHVDKLYYNVYLNDHFLGGMRSNFQGAGGYAVTKDQLLEMNVLIIEVDTSYLNQSTFDLGFVAANEGDYVDSTIDRNEHVFGRLTSEEPLI